MSQFLISHRGNLNGKNADLENQPDYIMAAINKGFDVEVDVWLYKDRLYLGHDEPQYPTSFDFLDSDRLWCHCKNIEAIPALLSKNIHCFYHQTDDITLTSKNFIWTYPNKLLVPNSICVMPELGYDGDLEACGGVCSDFIGVYR